MILTYRRGSEKIGLDREEIFGVPSGILGLRLSQLKRLGGRAGEGAEEGCKLPSEVYQMIMDINVRRMEVLCQEGSSLLLGDGVPD